MLQSFQYFSSFPTGSLCLSEHQYIIAHFCHPGQSQRKYSLAASKVTAVVTIPLMPRIAASHNL